jgi:hypothetical protein
MFRLQLFDGDQPRARQRYQMKVDGEERSGTTNADGLLEEFISPQTMRIELVIGPDELAVAFDIGHMDPINTPSGVKKRLHNLGFQELSEFQREHQLEPTGEADAATLKRLEKLHDQVTRR